MSNFFALLSRMKYIDRWALMRATRQETLSEHTLEVAMLSHALAVLGNTYLGKNIDVAHCALVALYHDAPEIITGDMPTPVKYLNKDIMTAYKKVEAIASEKLVSTLPEAMRSEYSSLLDDENNPQRRIIKAADKLAAYIKCLEELKAGNEEFRLAAQQTLDKLQSLNMPEVDYFLEHFIKSFELTLDELQLD